MNFLGFKIEEFHPTDGRETDVTYRGKVVWYSYSRFFFPILRARLFCLRNFWRAGSLKPLE